MWETGAVLVCVVIAVYLGVVIHRQKMRHVALWECCAVCGATGDIRRPPWRALIFGARMVIVCSDICQRRFRLPSECSHGDAA